LPIFLKCPDHKDNGALISIDENLKGKARRVILNYRLGTVQLVQVAIADTNSNYKGEILNVNLDTEANNDSLKLTGWIVRDVSPLKNKICNADSAGAKTRYDQLANANRNKLPKAAPDNFHEGVTGRNIQVVH